MLPSFDGARVVDLGCGFGAFCRWAAHRALRRCSAIDLSQRSSSGRLEALRSALLYVFCHWRGIDAAPLSPGDMSRWDFYVIERQPDGSVLLVRQGEAEAIAAGDEVETPASGTPSSPQVDDPSSTPVEPARTYTLRPFIWAVPLGAALFVAAEEPCLTKELLA